MLQQRLLRGLPTKPGVYIFKDKKGKTIYIGKAKDLRKRVGSYFSNKALDTKTIKLVSEIKGIEHIQVSSEIEAFLLEAELIKKHKPFYNIKFTDDKSYPYIAVAKGSNAGIFVTRNRRDKKNYYFGPYVDSSGVRTVLKLLRKIFPYQSVKNHSKKECLYYHLKLCPCVLAHHENLASYKKNLKKIRSFLKGNTKSVISELKKEQKALIREENFEEASENQRKIEYIEHITGERYFPFKYLEQPDFYLRRIALETSSLMEILKPYFPDLSNLKRIECYDISNLQGKNATGSMVVFNSGEKNAKEYRRFKIKSKKTPDDFAMMKEVLLRRFKKEGWIEPNLIVVDGGKGQVSSALQAITNRKKAIPIIGLAKREEVIIIPQKQIGAKLEFIELKIPKSKPALNLLRRIRDEAHRFAVNYHRLLRKKSFLS